ncbi:MAG: DUF948 domain-containing protein [Desulfuromonadales bacterium]|nr:DUF948 domain-containing protein [Desulfuromonadales bacterium]
MTYTEFALIIMAVTICALVLTLIPIIIAVKRTADSVSLLHRVINQELKPTLRELTVTLTEIKAISRDVAEHSTVIKDFMTVLSISGAILHTINRTVGMAAGLSHTVTAWTTGIRVTGHYIGTRFFTKKGGHDHV